jgi:hypothetical protein
MTNIGAATNEVNQIGNFLSEIKKPMIIATFKMIE